MLARSLKTGEKIMKRLVVALLGTVLLALAGCSGDSAASGPPSTSTGAGAPAGPATAGPSATSSSVPVSQCLTGRYRLVRFVGVGEKGTYGTGEGGDVTVTFNNGSYVLVGAGSDPIKLSLAGHTANMLVDGTISGDYRLDGDRARFTVGQSSGSATLQVGKVKKSVPISDVANVLAPDGEASLACASNALIVTLQDVRLELGKIS
jgi:hypothetical protein